MGTKLRFLVPRAPPGVALPAGRGVEDAFCWEGEAEISWRNCELFIVVCASLDGLVGVVGRPVGGGVVVGAKRVGSIVEVGKSRSLGLGGPVV